MVVTGFFLFVVFVYYVPFTFRRYGYPNTGCRVVKAEVHSPVDIPVILDLDWIDDVNMAVEVLLDKTRYLSEIRYVFLKKIIFGAFADCFKTGRFNNFGFCPWIIV